LGCGDLTWIPKSKFFNDSNISYTGIDIVDFLIESHKSKYPTKNFDCQDITEYKFKKEYDLIILRDVIFHLKNEQIINIFKNIKNKFKYIGITTCTNKINLNEFDKWNYNQKNIHIEPFNINNNSNINVYEPKFNRYFKIFNSSDFNI
jgi:viroplasmin and RNaseH domain-containing protein